MKTVNFFGSCFAIYYHTTEVLPHSNSNKSVYTVYNNNTV